MQNRGVRMMPSSGGLRLTNCSVGFCLYSSSCLSAICDCKLVHPAKIEPELRSFLFRSVFQRLFCEQACRPSVLCRNHYCYRSELAALLGFHALTGSDWMQHITTASCGKGKVNGLNLSITDVDSSTTAKYCSALRQLGRKLMLALKRVI